nr:hypothetical protein [Tanacetum cinerariifolium]
QLGRLAAQVQAQGIDPGKVAVHEAAVGRQLGAVVGEVVVGGAHKVEHPPGPGARRVHDRAPQLPRLPEAGVGSVAFKADVESYRRAQRSYRLPRNIEPVNIKRAVHKPDKGIVGCEKQQGPPPVFAPDKAGAKTILLSVALLGAASAPAFAQKPAKLKYPTDDNSRVYDAVEQPAVPKGGPQGYADYLASHQKYPTAAMQAKQEGTVMVTFVVEKSGGVGEVEVKQPIAPLLDAEA